jgi:hypothetical protein
MPIRLTRSFRFCGALVAGTMQLACATWVPVRHAELATTSPEASVANPVSGDRGYVHVPASCLICDAAQFFAPTGREFATLSVTCSERAHFSLPQPSPRSRKALPANSVRAPPQLQRDSRLS